MRALPHLRSIHEIVTYCTTNDTSISLQLLPEFPLAQPTHSTVALISNRLPGVALICGFCAIAV